MTDEEIASWLEVVCEAPNKILLCRPVKIDHDVATEDDGAGVVAGKLIHEIEVHEVNHGAYLGLEAQAIGTCVLTLEHVQVLQMVWDAFATVRWIDPTDGFLKNPRGNIGGTNVEPVERFTGGRFE